MRSVGLVEDPARGTATWFAHARFPRLCWRELARLAWGCLFLATPASARAYHTLAEAEGSPTPIVWSAPPSIALDLSGLPEARAELLSAELEASIATWNALECAGDLAVFAGRGVGSAPVVVRMIPDWTGYDPDAAGTTDLVMASTMDGSTAIVGATLSLNGTMAWGSHPQEGVEGPRDLRAVITHELGHVLGLEHSEDPDATMYAAYTGSSQATLGDDDIAGICALYAPPTPPPPPACAIDDQCPRGDWCIEGACHPDLRFGSECMDGSECFGARCVEIEGGGACTYVCEQDADCPSGARCRAVEGRDERVCAPVMPKPGCSVSPGGRPVPFFFVALFVSSLLLVTRRSRSPLARALRSRSMCVVALLVASCGGPPEVDDGGRGIDAGSETNDAGSVPDAATRADADTPTDGGPDTPDAGTAPECEPGEMRVGPCGFCGDQGQRCDEGGHWMASSECLGQGECAVGSVETRDLDMCAQEQRLCLEGCMWGDWEASRAPGPCTPGDTRDSGASCGPGESREEVCNDACAWEGASDCVINPCGVVPRTTPDWESEVCVPAGTFYRGSTTYDDAQPVAEVYLSAYMIDAYPVTNRRYQECVLAGGCAIPAGYPKYYTMPERIDYPVQGLTRAQADVFCSWDGGRRLPTEAEWEKAVRGPSPRMNPFPWDGASWDCSMLTSWICGYSGSSEGRYDSQPGTRSYYGTYLQIGGVAEFVADFYSADFYSDPRSLSDPEFTEADAVWDEHGPVAVARGFILGRQWEISRRDPFYIMDNYGHVRATNVGLRCARSAP